MFAVTRPDRVAHLIALIRIRRRMAIEAVADATNIDADRLRAIEAAAGEPATTSELGAIVLALLG